MDYSMDNEDWQIKVKEQIDLLDSQLKANTVIAWLEQKVMGRPYDTFDFWKRADTCARSTWNKWKTHDSQFNDVLDRTWEIARDNRSSQAATAITDAVLMLQLNAPAFAEQVVEIATGTYKAEVSLRAALAGLDRASALTAEKQVVDIPGLDDAMELIWGNAPEPAEDDDSA